MTVFLSIMGAVAAILLVLMGWGWWATRKPWVIDIYMDDRPDHYKQAEKELRS